MSIMRDEAKIYADAIRPAIAVMVVAFVLLMSSAIAGRSQEIGDVRAGFDYARRVCAECHAILATPDPSPVAKATPFRIVANTPGMTGHRDRRVVAHAPSDDAELDRQGR